MTSLTTVYTMSSLPTQHISAQPTIVFTQESSTTIILIIIVSFVLVVLLSILVLVTVFVCAYCHKKTKPSAGNSDLDPAYETPGDVMPSSLPFAMSSSSAYGVVKDPQTSSSPKIMSSAYEPSKSANTEGNSSNDEY